MAIEVENTVEWQGALRVLRRSLNIRGVFKHWERPRILRVSLNIKSVYMDIKSIFEYQEYIFKHQEYLPISVTS